MSEDKERAAFEADAEPMGFDLTRMKCAVPEPWSEYLDDATGHRWAGWLAGRASLAQQAAPATFPTRILDLLRDVADREPKHCFGPWEDGKGEPLQDDADAALAWIAEQAGEDARDGWQLVPVEPTKAMMDAAFEVLEIPAAYCGFGTGTEARNAVYAAMLAAAPPPAIDQAMKGGEG